MVEHRDATTASPQHARGGQLSPAHRTRAGHPPTRSYRRLRASLQGVSGAGPWRCGGRRARAHGCVPRRRHPRPPRCRPGRRPRRRPGQRPRHRHGVDHLADQAIARSISLTHSSSGGPGDRPHHRRRRVHNVAPCIPSHGRPCEIQMTPPDARPSTSPAAAACSVSTRGRQRLPLVSSPRWGTTTSAPSSTPTRKRGSSSSLDAVQMGLEAALGD